MLKSYRWKKKSLQKKNFFKKKKLKFIKKCIKKSSFELKKFIEAINFFYSIFFVKNMGTSLYSVTYPSIYLKKLFFWSWSRRFLQNPYQKIVKKIMVYLKIRKRFRSFIRRKRKKYWKKLQRRAINNCKSFNRFKFQLQPRLLKLVLYYCLKYNLFKKRRLYRRWRQNYFFLFYYLQREYLWKFKVYNRLNTWKKISPLLILFKELQSLKIKQYRRYNWRLFLHTKFKKRRFFRRLKRRYPRKIKRWYLLAYKPWRDFRFRFFLRKFKQFKKQRRPFRFYYRNTTILKKYFHLFYGKLTLNQVKHLKQKSSISRSRFRRFISFLEFRLDVVLYRLGALATLHWSRFVIKNKHVFINFKLVKWISYIIPVGSQVMLSFISLCQLKKSPKAIRLSHRLKRIKRNLFWGYAEINYKIYSCIFLRFPFLDELFYKNKVRIFNHFFLKKLFTFL